MIYKYAKQAISLSNLQKYELLECLYKNSSPPFLYSQRTCQNNHQIYKNYTYRSFANKTHNLHFYHAEFNSRSNMIEIVLIIIIMTTIIQINNNNNNNNKKAIVIICY